MHIGTRQRASLVDEVADAIRGLILDGSLEAGARINEVHLAERLSVSRTPLREAMGRLVAEGAIRARPRHGHYVKAMTADEFQQLYAIRPLLDPEALRLAGLPDKTRLARLAKLNDELLEARGPEDIVSLDDAWHRMLLADCPNRELTALIESMMLRTRRYELAYMREVGAAQRAACGHGAIIFQLGAGNLDGACNALRQNLVAALPPIMAWLSARPGSTLERTMRA